MCFDKSRIVGEVNKNLLCPICSCVFCIDCVQDREGNVFCRSCIEKYVEEKSKGMSTAASLNMLIPAPVLFKNILKDVVVTCSFKELGCEQSVKLDEIDQHEKSCKYHRHQCKKGCDAFLSPDEITDHDCIKYLKEIIIGNEERHRKMEKKYLKYIKQLKQEKETLENENENLKQMSVFLTPENKTLKTRSIERIPAEFNKEENKKNRGLLSRQDSKDSGVSSNQAISKSQGQVINIYPITPFALCNYPDDRLLIADNKRLCVLNKNYRLVKAIDRINNEKFWIKGLTTDNENYLFMVDWDNHRVIKTDFDFNKLAIFGGKKGNDSDKLCFPLGIAYYKNAVYVCDTWNKRIQKLSADILEQKVAFKLNYMPEKIEILNETVCIRCENAIYFHSLRTFEVKCNYTRGLAGIIGKHDTKFYELCKNNFYIYDENGEIIESNSLNVACEMTSTDGGIIMFNDKLTIGSESEGKLIVDP